jgi:alkylhydroperoxidase family enzyme
VGLAVTSWVAGSTSESLDELVSSRTALASARDKLHHLVWSGTDVSVDLLRVVRLRMAQLVGTAQDDFEEGISISKAAKIRQWPTAAAFSATERACLALAEQFVMDPKGVTDAGVRAVRDSIGDRGAVAFMIALALFEGDLRAARVLGVSSTSRGDNRWK